MAMKNISFVNTNGIQIVNAGDVTLENVKIEITEKEAGWQGIYALQVYGASHANLKGISVTGADGGILINGAEVKLDGVVDVSGNEFGGIEVAKGEGVTTMPKLTGTSANLNNDTETAGKPSVWIDKVSELTSDVVALEGLHKSDVPEKDQMHFFLHEESLGIFRAATLEQLEAALANTEAKVIKITEDILSDKTLQVNRPVMIVGEDGMKNISFVNTNGIQIVNAGDVTLENVKIEITEKEAGWQGIVCSAGPTELPMQI